GFAGQGELKRCGSRGVCDGPQAAAMRFDDGSADGQSHSCALRFGREEGIEDLLRLFRLQSHARIADRDQELTIVVLLRLDRKFTSSAHVLHGFDAIEHEVHQYLLQLHTVRHDLGKIVGKLATDRNRIPARLTAEQDNHFSNELIYIDQLVLQSALLEQQADAANDVGCAHYVFDG